MRHTWRFFDYDAKCRDCGWQSSGKNALGIAAQHHDRTGHSVDIDVSGCVAYLSDADNEKNLADRNTATAERFFRNTHKTRPDIINHILGEEDAEARIEAALEGR